MAGAKEAHNLTKQRLHLIDALSHLTKKSTPTQRSSLTQKSNQTKQSRQTKRSHLMTHSPNRQAHRTRLPFVLMSRCLQVSLG